MYGASTEDIHCAEYEIVILLHLKHVLKNKIKSSVISFFLNLSVYGLRQPTRDVKKDVKILNFKSDVTYALP